MKTLSTILFYFIVIFSNAATPPTYIGGALQSFTICQNAATTSINNLLSVNDADTGNILTWAVIKAPQQGTLQGFPGIRASNGGAVTPSGFGYTPSGVYNGLDSFTISLNDGTTTIQTTIKVTINPIATISPIVGTSILCLGQSATLTNATNGGTWVSSLPAVATINTSGAITTVATGTTQITYSISNGFGCTSSASLSLTVSGYPVVDSIIGDSSLCVPYQKQYTCATVGGVWSSQFPTAASINSAGLLTGLSGTVSGGSLKVFYAVTNAAGCTKTVSKTVGIFASVTLNNNSIITGGVCVFKGLQINNTTPIFGATVTNWSSSNPSIATVDNTGFVVGIASGIDTIQYNAITAAGCVSKAISIITVSTPPTVASITGASVMCGGTTAQFLNATSGGVWSSSTPLVATVSSTGFVTAAAQGTTIIKYIVTNASGCAASATLNLAVDTIPVVSNIVGTNSLCTGNSATLTNSTAGGVWSSDSTHIASINNSGIVTAIKAGTTKISYTVTNNKGCNNAATINLTVSPTLSVSPIVYSSSKICTGSTGNFTCATSGGVWSSSNNAVAVITNVGVLTALSEGIDTIKYFVNGGSGCSGYSTFILNVYQMPVVPANVTSVTSLCVNVAATISNTTGGGVWSTSNPTIISVSSTGALMGLRTGSAIIQYAVDNNGCKKTVSNTLAVNANPTVNAITGLNSYCVGSGATLSNTTSSGVWSSSNTSLAIISSGGFVTGLAAGNLDIKYTVANISTKCTTVVTYPIVINTSLFVAPITGADTICVGGSSVNDIYSSATTLGTWSTSNSSIATIPVGGHLIGISAGVVDVIYTVSNGAGCVSNVSKTVRVLSLPVVTPITGPNTVCSGSTISLSATPTGGLWSHYNVYLSVDSSTGNVTGVKGGSETVSYTYADNFGCKSTVSYSVTVSPPLPLSTNITGTVTGTWCVGKTTQLSNATTGGVWHSTFPEYASVSSTGLLKINAPSAVNVTISYIVQSSVSGQCAKIASVSTTTKGLPSVTPILGSPNTLCQNESGFIDNATAGGVWGQTNAALAYVSSIGGTFTGLLPGTDSITYKVTNVSSGCSNTAYFPLVIKPLPILDTISGNTKLCLGLTSKLNCSPSGGVWTLGNSIPATIDSTGLITPIKVGNTSVIYTYTGSNGCTGTTDKPITVSAIPIVAPITGSSVSCLSKTKQLSNATIGGVWKNSFPNITTINQLGSVTGVSIGTDTIKYIFTNTGGCSDSVQKAVTVYPLPTVDSIVGRKSICFRYDSTIYTNTTLGGVWTSQFPNYLKIDSVTGFAKCNVSYSNQSNIYYTVTSSIGCSNMTTKLVNINLSYKNPGSIYSAGLSNCVGGNAIIFGATANGGFWTSSDSNIIKILPGPLFKELSSGTAEIKYTTIDTNGCINFTTTSVLVNPLPVVNPIFGINKVCVNKSTNFINTTVGGVWKLSNSSIGSINSTGFFYGINAGNTDIKYIVTDAKGCKDSAILPIVIHPKPVITATTNSPVSLGQTIQFNGLSNDSIATWNWFGPSFISNLQNPTIPNASLVSVGTYSVYGTSVAGCVSDTTTLNIVVADKFLVSGRIISAVKKVIPNSTVKISGGIIANVVPDLNGHYSLYINPGSDFTAKIAKNNDITKANGINATDVLFTQRHILNTTKLNSAYKLIAADVNGDKQINSTDVLRIKRLILGTDTTFTSATKGNRLWEFVDSAYQFPDTTNPFPFKDSISFTNLSSNKINQTFIGVKLGDVNYDWNPIVAKGITAKPIVLFYDDINEVGNDLIRIPLRVKDFNKIVAMQYTLGFNSEALEYIGVENNTLKIDYNDKEAQKGLISFLWTDAQTNPKTLEDGTIIFELVFKKKQNFTSEDITIHSKITDVEAYDKDYQLHNIVKGKGIINTKSITRSIDNIFTVNPNPTRGFVNVLINSSSNKTIQLMLVDIYGKILFVEKVKLVNGVNSFNLNLQKNNIFPSGIYVLKTLGLENEDVKQISIIN